MDSNKKHRDDLDAEVIALIHRGVTKAGDVEAALKSSTAAQALTTGLRSLARVVDQSLQRLRKAGAISFQTPGLAAGGRAGHWKVTREKSREK